MRGFVSIFDNVQKQYIFKNKENLITNAGREFVKQLFTLNSGILGKNVSAKFANDMANTFNLSACVFGTNTNVSRPDMIYVPTDYVLDYSILTSSKDFAVTYNEDMILQMTITLNGISTKQTMISNLALVMTTGEEPNAVQTLLRSGDNTNTALFSRLLFDPIPIGAGTSQTITYCIYF